MDKQEARNIFGLQDKVYSTQTLKSLYRQKSRYTHPDLGGTNEDFIALKSAYDLLLVDANKEESVETKTIDNVLLSELGKGYPLNVNAKTCDLCKGYGYKTYNDTEVICETCKSCKGEGVFFVRCRTCSGLGYFRNPQTNKNVGTCEQCHGSGRFYPPFKPKTIFSSAVFIKLSNGKLIKANKCNKCHGSGNSLVIKEINRKYYHTCDMCQGIGEIKIANPVLPRGLFAAKG